MRALRHSQLSLRTRNGSTRHVQNLALLLSLCLMSVPFYSQDKPRSGQQSSKAATTIRVNVSLIHTDVMVFDRQDRFVDNLTQDQFELLVDGKPQPISFFEHAYTREPVAAARLEKGVRTKATPAIPAVENGLETGRTLMFFLDDWHLSAESTNRTRATLSNLIEKSMGVNDRGAIFTASGQLGFLEQLTDNKAVLRLAVARLKFTNETISDLARPLMNVVQAVAIERNDDPDLFRAFVDETMKIEGLEEPYRYIAEEIVRQRAASIAGMSAEITSSTLTALANIVRSCTALPGRKVIFFLSDGFVLQYQKDDVVYRMRRVTDAAARAGIVIYTVDTRGLVVGLPSAASPTTVAIRPTYSEVLEYQDGLNALASDTGGRFIKNTNALDEAIVKSLEETSRYYILGWYVDPSKLQRGHLSPIQVSIRDRPDLKIRERRGSLDLSKLIDSEPAPQAIDGRNPNAIRDALVKALEFPWPLDALPTYLYTGYVYYPDKGFAIDVSLQADIEPGDSGTGDLPGGSSVDIMGVITNREGKTVDTFRETLSQPVATADSLKLINKEFRCSHLSAIDPGLYHVRVAARDSLTGRIGSAHGWVEIPSAVVGKTVLSSVFLKESPARNGSQTKPTPAPLSPEQFSVKCSFQSSSRLSFTIQIFNPASLPLLLHAKAYRGNLLVAESIRSPLPPAADAIAWPRFFGGDFPLDGLVPGPYELEVTASDPSGKSTSSRRLPFWIR